MSWPPFLTWLARHPEPGNQPSIRLYFGPVMKTSLVPDNGALVLVHTTRCRDQICARDARRSCYRDPTEATATARALRSHPRQGVPRSERAASDL